MRRIMIAGTGSGSGKTTVVCGIMQALADRGLKISSFKCGPDYIDPMFHGKIIGTNSFNLDGFFCGDDMLRYLFDTNSAGGDISVIEGVMGFYDGVRLADGSEKASSHNVSMTLNCPAAVVIDCKGMSTSIGAVMKGFLTFRQPNNIRGFIFNRLPASLENYAKELCSELGTEYLGYMPTCRKAALESRHLGLVTADEIKDIKEKMKLLSFAAEENIRLDRLLELSDYTEFPQYSPPKFQSGKYNGLTVAVARDEAFSFIYRDNISLLEKMGCKIEWFSPLNDEIVPENADGIILSGGYPELHAKRLSENKTMLKSVHDRIIGGIPTIAECGGFIYLHKEAEGADGGTYPLAGVIDGRAFRTDRLGRFGYVYMTAHGETAVCSAGDIVSAHEFHYWDSTSCGESFTAEKPNGSRSWECVHGGHNSYMGFPHLYFYSDIRTAESFLDRCAEYHLLKGND